MRIKALVIATALGLLGVPGLANAVPAASSVAQFDISRQSDFLPVQWGPGPGPGGPGPWGPGPGPGPGGPGPWPGPPGDPGTCPSPWGPVPCPL
jgi:hypothetical protein